MSTVDRIWFGDDAVAATARAALWPFAAVFGVGVRARSALYEAGVLAIRRAALPAISVGNLSVGGTGKTPFSAWLAARLSPRARVAIVLRGYGGDEGDVHRTLNPGIAVLELSDRALGVQMAKGAGAQLAILDDAFQHRRVTRDVDIVLVSAEQLRVPVRLLPAGPWRENLAGARRASLIVVTAKSADDSEVRSALDRIAAAAPGVPTASVRLVPRRLHRVGGSESMELTSLSGQAVLAIAAIGDPGAFATQLEALGARVTLRAFRDHHAFTGAEAALLADAESGALCVCTLKDAVKLGRLWPASRALWYLSQEVEVQHGLEHIDRLSAQVLERVVVGATT